MLVGYDPYPAEMAGLFKDIKKKVTKTVKKIKGRLRPPKHLRKKLKKTFKRISKNIKEPFKPLSHWKMKDISKAFKRAFVMPGRVKKAFREGGIGDAFEMWLETELDPVMSDFGKGKTFITPTDVLLAPLSLLVPGSGPAVGAAVKASAIAGAQIGAKAAAWQAVKTVAIKMAPDVASEAIKMGMDLHRAKQMARDMKKLARRAEREEAIAIDEEMAARKKAIAIAEEAAPLDIQAVVMRAPEKKPVPWVPIAVGATALYLITR